MERRMVMRNPLAAEAVGIDACPRCAGCTAPTWLEGKLHQGWTRWRTVRCLNCGWYAVREDDARQLKLWRPAA
jgi:Zn-finger nucleic acid-binding protein